MNSYKNISKQKTKVSRMRKCNLIKTEKISTR